MVEIAYRELKPGEVIQAGDEWKSLDGGTACWQGYHSDMIGKTLSEFCVGKVRRPYNITELLKQRDQAAHEYRLHREAVTAEQAAYKITMANGLQACKERDEAERLLTEERAAHQQTSRYRDQLSIELSECQQQRQRLQAALEELRRRQDAAAGDDTPAVAEVIENILSALEIAGHALEYLADVGVNEEAGHYSGFSAAIAVVRKIKESTK